MTFLIVGTGGVGGYFGGKLARSGKNVWFVARGAHLEAMKQNGLVVKSAGETFVVPPGKMTDRPSDAGPCDVILVCVKSPDTEQTAAALAGTVSPSTLIISLQNGIDNEERIRSIIASGIVWGGVSYIYATITAPGEVTETGGPKKIVFGPLDAASSTYDERGRTLRDLMQEAGIDATYTKDIRTQMWKKFIFISAVGGLTALTRLTLAELLAVDASRTLLEEAMRETRAVATALGIAIEPGYIDAVFASFARSNNNAYSSMYYDLTHDKPMELEAFSGTVVREGTRHGIPTPVHKTIYASLLPHHLKHSQPRH